MGLLAGDRLPLRAGYLLPARQTRTGFDLNILRLNDKLKDNKMNIKTPRTRETCNPLSQPESKKADKALRVAMAPDADPEKVMADLTVSPFLNGGMVVQAFTTNLLGEDATGITELVESLRDSARNASDGDLSTLEGMLISQATALQTIFASYARRAQAQSQQRNLEAFMGMALKAQAQSRATIQAVIELKYPRQATFVKQANIAHGPQQVNNGTAAPDAGTHAENMQPEQNKLLEASSNGRTYLDTGAAPKAARSHQVVAAVDKVYRPSKRRG